jgi:hypothetical protein
MAYRDDCSCLEKAAPDEPIFVLRAQDLTAPKVVLNWISENFLTCPDEKLREAFEHALRMKNYHTKKIAD